MDRYYDGKGPKYFLGVNKDYPDGYSYEEGFDFNNEFDLKRSVRDSIDLSEEEIEEYVDDGNESGAAHARRWLEIEKEIYRILFK